MRFHALAADYDGTLAHHGRIDEATWAALRRLRESGRKIVMVTGRELDDLLAHIAHPEVFDRIVAENGAVVYDPTSREIRTAHQPPPARFVDELRRRGVAPLSCGRVIVATWEPHEDTVFHVIHEQGLELQVIFNKRAVMVLPTGVNKATGLTAALAELGLSRHNVVGVGDAENDHALLDCSECGVAVANAVEPLREHADVVTCGDHGPGVIELIDRLIADDLADAANLLSRHRILVGRGPQGDVAIDPYRSNVVICGTSGAGKSTLTHGLLERLAERGYQFAIVDPEGDYRALDIAVVLGGPTREPLVSEVIDVLRHPADNAAINLLGVAVEHRPECFLQLLAALSDLRTRTGRPHWLVVDEAHHLLPESWQTAEGIELRPHGTVYVTLHPKSIAKAVLAKVDTVIAIGDHPDASVRELCTAAGIAPPPSAAQDRKLPTGHAVFWRVGAPEAIIVQTEPPKGERRRHSRKYIEGNLGRDRSFYFRGRDGRLNLKAHNLQLFVHLGAGVDDETWCFHLWRGDYSRWLRHEVKDPELAAEVEAIERTDGLAPGASRAAVRAAVDKRYILPTDKASGIVDI